MFFNEKNLDSSSVFGSPQGPDGHFDVLTPEKECNTRKEKKQKKQKQLWAWRDVCGLLNLEAGMFSCVSFIKNVDWEDGPGSECVGWFYRPSDGATFLRWSVALLADLQVSHLPLEKVDVSFLIFYVSHLWKGDASKSCTVALKPASQEEKKGSSLHFLQICTFVD